jgi:hypothetical protein
MSRRSVISSERSNTVFESVQNSSGGVVLNCVIIDICGAHKPTTPHIPIVCDNDGTPRRGFYASGIVFILFDLVNKEVRDVPWKGSYDELRTIYGTDENIVGRGVNLHCASNSEAAIQASMIQWEREDYMLFQNESAEGYISLAGCASITVNDYESQMKSFSKASIGKGRRWNRL